MTDVSAMLTLLTSNPAKYGPFGELLDRLQIAVRVPEFTLPESQGDDFLAVLRHKAQYAHDAFGGPCLVDDAGLVLDAYPEFPGPMTRAVCKLLGAAGMERLLTGITSRGRLVCHLGCAVRGELWHWGGEVAGSVDPRRPAGPGPGPLTQWFVPDVPGEAAVFSHRRRALEALGKDIVALRRAIQPPGDGEGTAPLEAAAHAPSAVCNCVFCAEFNGSRSSIFHELLGEEFPSRIIRRTEHFLVFPPLGQFIEGGLLLATREHLLSMAHLPESYYDELEQLMEETSDLLLEHYGCRPLFFEHAPLAPGDKGTCCVDHAHLNVFPVGVDVAEHLRKSPHSAIARMRELAERRDRNQAYLFLQTNEGNRWVYDTGIVPSQYIRRIIATRLGMPERWHWREYLGLEELKRTLATLGPARK